MASKIALPQWLSGKESACDTGDLGSISGSGRSPGKGNGNPLQYSCLEKSMDRGAWRAPSLWGHKELDMTEHPLSAIASPGKSHVPSWSVKRYFAPLMRHQMFPDTPVSLDRNTEVPAPLHLSTFSPPVWDRRDDLIHWIKLKGMKIKRFNHANKRQGKFHNNATQFLCLWVREKWSKLTFESNFPLFVLWYSKSTMIAIK